MDANRQLRYISYMRKNVALATFVRLAR
uniref:Uncharacterized protein n=1 Tax=Anguilla anguilla TaxID=7936 RepID=A0A0E9WEE2_ANGAN